MEKKQDYMEGFLLGKLPKVFAESEASIHAKKVMGALLFHAETYKKVRETGVIACSDAQLRKVASIGSKYLLPAIDELVSYGLIERKAGSKWKQGEEKRASEYMINLEGLFQPLRKKEENTEDFMSKFFFLKRPSKPNGDGVGSTYTNTDTNTDTITKPCTPTDKESYAKTDVQTETPSSSFTKSDADAQASANTDLNLLTNISSSSFTENDADAQASANTFSKEKSYLNLLNDDLKNNKELLKTISGFQVEQVEEELPF